jgi:hypothetical protein
MTRRLEDEEWVVIGVGGEPLQQALNRERWTCRGFTVFQILSCPDRIVFHKEATAEDD